MTMTLGPGFLRPPLRRSGFRIVRLLAALWLLTTGLSAADPDDSRFLPNPSFADADGDGKPDGWETKTFILEKFRGTSCLSMKMPRKDKSSFTGKASGTFRGPAGFYRVTVGYLDEKDGVSKAKLLVNGDVRHIWNFDGTFGDCWREEIIENVELKPGDAVTLWGRDNPTEYCRIRSLSVAPTPVPPTPEELAERRTPPVIADFEPGPLVPLAVHRDLAAENGRPESRPLILGGPILFLASDDPTVAFNLVLDQPRTPVYSYGCHGPDATGRERITFSIKDAPLAFDASTNEATIRPPAGGKGLCELRAPQGHWEADVPHVLAVQGRSGDSVTAAGTGLFYFFVPRGTQALGVGAYCYGDSIAEVTVRGPDGMLIERMDVPKNAEQGLLIRVRSGQDDAVWSVTVAGVSPRIRICGVPPYVATHPRHLLVPKNCLPTGRRP